MTLSSGTRLGPYEILSLIGAGGMGEVYKATDTRLDRIVAIKVLPTHLSDRPDLRERFEREAGDRTCAHACPACPHGLLETRHIISAACCARGLE